jgi:hypothetical protein
MAGFWIKPHHFTKAKSTRLQSSNHYPKKHFTANLGRERCRWNLSDGLWENFGFWTPDTPTYSVSAKTIEQAEAATGGFDYRSHTRIGPTSLRTFKKNHSCQNGKGDQDTCATSSERSNYSWWHVITKADSAARERR